MPDTEKTFIDTESFICTNCGATMTFNIKKQKFMCSACKTEKDIITTAKNVMEHDLSGYNEREKRSIPFDGVAAASCGNCGTVITFDDNQIAAVCPMCASSQIAEIKQKAGIPPDGIIPFKVDKQDAQQRFRVWVKARWFAPNDFKKKYGEGGLKGMYLPFWAYGANVTSHYTGLGGRYRVVRDKDGKTRTEVDWFPASGVVQNKFTDVQICATDKEKKIEGILPYRLQTETRPYSTVYLSGYYAELYSIKADRGFESAKSAMEQTMRSLAENQIRASYDTAQVHTISSTYKNVKYKHVLLPLWTSTFGYNGKQYRYIINGETGNVAGERPYSIPKIAAAVIACVLIIIAIILTTSDDNEYVNEYNYSVQTSLEMDFSTAFDCYEYTEIGDVT